METGNLLATMLGRTQRRLLRVADGSIRGGQPGLERERSGKEPQRPSGLVLRSRGCVHATEGPGASTDSALRG
jgi:hypothetical protein